LRSNGLLLGVPLQAARVRLPRRHWPTDEHLREAIRTRPSCLSGRGPQRTLILERLEENFGHQKQVDFETAVLTIENVMPQAPSQEWRDHRSGRLGSAGSRAASARTSTRRPERRIAFRPIGASRILGPLPALASARQERGHASSIRARSCSAETWALAAVCQAPAVPATARHAYQSRRRNSP
jgi:thymidylate synthase ThyX